MKLLPACFLLISLHSYSQPYLELVSAQFHIFLAGSGDDPVITDKDCSDWFAASISAPWQMDSNNVLLFSPSFEYRSIKESSFSATGYRTLYFPLTWMHAFKNSRYKFSLTGIYRYNSDAYVNFGRDNDQTGGALIIYRKQSENLTYKAGIYYNKEFFGNLWIPFLGLDARIGERIFIWALLPRALMADYTLLSSLHTGIAFRGIEESYRIGTSELTDYFRPNEGYLRLYFDYYIPHTMLVATAGAGHTLRRRYYYGNELKEFETLPKPKFILQGGLSMRIVTDKRFVTRRKP
jgi:hypothetical protein